jgi:hypothetical protein
MAQTDNPRRKIRCDNNRPMFQWDFHTGLTGRSP